MGYYIDIHHDGLNKYRRVTGTDPHVVEQKAAAQMATWDEMWEKKLEVERRARERDNKAKDKQTKISLAAKRTAEAQSAIEEMSELLSHTLRIDDKVNWDSLKAKSTFPKKKPASPKRAEYDQEPKMSWPEYTPSFGLADRLVGSRRQRKQQECEEQFKRDHATWMAQCQAVDQAHDKRQKDYEKAVADWEKEKAEFLRQQAEINREVDARKAAYESRDPGAVADYCDLVLSNSQYPDYFPQQWELDYNPETRVIVVDYVLPSVDLLPRIREVKYVQSRDTFEEKQLPESAVNKLYDDLVYQTTLRTVHELFEADVVSALDMVVLNGWVNSLDRATGREMSACIVSLQATKNEFLDINLDQVDPKACFKGLKGVGSSRLHTITPVAPLICVNREDKRFVSSFAVADSLDGGVNIAEMDWEEFEHLVRELFEKEFAQSGGECKVTRASRDGGVDAIAFDPDPIRGGKIVIQAKRYTNTVGVSAVRDLYGTVVNEGATKGILVTTADYGPDAYEFAKGKPLTLLNGGNLLHLLEKHGHKAVIDVKAAKLSMGPS